MPPYLRLIILFFLSNHLIYSQLSAANPKLLFSRSSPFFKAKKGPFLEENLQDGKVLLLDDGTMWEVAHENIERAKMWSPPLSLQLKKSGKKDYPYYIINKQSKTRVLVRPFSKSERPQTETAPSTAPSRQTEMPPSTDPSHDPSQPPLDQEDRMKSGPTPSTPEGSEKTTETPPSSN